MNCSKRRLLQAFRMGQWYIDEAMELSYNTDRLQNGGEIMTRKYNKLVRDRIPEIIESSGKTCVKEILSDEDYLRMVDTKLDEELAE